MSLVSAVIIILTIVGLAIWTGLLVFSGLTTGAVGTGTLTIIVTFFTWLAIMGVRAKSD